MTARAHVFFSGRVQGVWFRKTTYDKASGFGLNGWVKNLPDGRVEAVFEGEKAVVEEVIKYCAEKITRAHVEWVETEWEDPKDEGAFEIR